MSLLRGLARGALSRIGRSRCTVRMFAQDAASKGADGAAAGPGDAAAMLAEKDGKIAELKDSYLRLLADMENLRTRTRKETEAASQYAITKFSKDVIGVADVLEMALKAVDPAHPLLTGRAAEQAQPADDAPAVPRAADTSPLGQLVLGIEMTLEETRKVLMKHGIVPIEPLHQPFDPHMHNALFQVPTAAVAPGTVVAVVKRGYSLHQRVLRAADVGVAKQPSAAEGVQP